MKNGDQPAYPLEAANGVEWTDSEGKKIKERSSFKGLTKREIIAAMAMQGIITATMEEVKRYQKIDKVLRIALAVSVGIFSYLAYLLLTF